MSEEIDRLEEMAGTVPPAEARALVEQLGSVKDVRAAAALRRLASTASSVEVRKMARRALHRLASFGIQPPAEAGASVARPDRREWRAAKTIASPIDGAGNRAMWLIIERGGETRLIGLVLNDRSGIADFFTTDMLMSRLDKEAARLLGDAEQPWIELPEDYCRQLIQEAHDLNAPSGSRLPPEFVAWMGAIGHPEGSYERPLVYTVMNPAEVRWDPRYLDHSDDLFQLRMFQTWIIAKEETEEYVRDILSVRQSGLVLAGAAPEARETMVLDRAIRTLFDADRRALYKRRLEEMAYHLWTLGLMDPAKEALAAALALWPEERSLMENPFVRRMVEWSLSVAAAMEEEAHTKSLGSGVRLHLPH